jgi:hypothetical protein
VRFITFNYDVSLELALYQGLRHIQRFETRHVNKFLARDRICHIYGRVRPVPPVRVGTPNWDMLQKHPYGLNQDELKRYVVEFPIALDIIYETSRGLRVIDPTDKTTDDDVIESASRAIERAKHVYILGYGFDENNSNRLGLGKSLHYDGLSKSVHFTNFGDNNRVNKRASNLFYGSMGQFPPERPLIFPHQHGYYERSFRNVYDALERDFESLEQAEEKAKK